jgi:hypothetical protein
MGTKELTGSSEEMETTTYGAAAIGIDSTATSATMSCGAGTGPITFVEERGTTFSMATPARMFCTAMLATTSSMAATTTESSSGAQGRINFTEAGTRIAQRRGRR